MGEDWHRCDLANPEFAPYVYGRERTGTRPRPCRSGRHLDGKAGPIAIPVAADAMRNHRWVPLDERAREPSAGSGLKLGIGAAQNFHDPPLEVEIWIASIARSHRAI